MNIRFDFNGFLIKVKCLPLLWVEKFGRYQLKVTERVRQLAGPSEGGTKKKQRNAHDGNVSNSHFACFITHKFRKARAAQLPRSDPFCVTNPPLPLQGWKGRVLALMSCSGASTWLCNLLLTKVAWSRRNKVLSHMLSRGQAEWLVTVWAKEVGGRSTGVPEQLGWPLGGFCPQWRCFRMGWLTASSVSVLDCSLIMVYRFARLRCILSEWKQ